MFVVCGRSPDGCLHRRDDAHRPRARRPHRRLAAERGAWAWRARASRSPSWAASRPATCGDRLLAVAARRRRRRWTPVHRSDAPTTLSLVGVDARGVPDYAFYGTGAADRTLPLATLPALPADARVLHVRLLHDGGRRDGRHAARAGRPRARPAAGQPTTRTCASTSSPTWRAGARRSNGWSAAHRRQGQRRGPGPALSGSSPAAVAADWLGKGAVLVAVTRGGKGAFAWHASGACDVPPVQVDVIDTVGAGDTFQAGAADPARRTRRADARRRARAGRPGAAGR